MDISEEVSILFDGGTFLGPNAGCGDTCSDPKREVSNSVAVILQAEYNVLAKQVQQYSE